MHRLCIVSERWKKMKEYFYEIFNDWFYYLSIFELKFSSSFACEFNNEFYFSSFFMLLLLLTDRLWILINVSGAWNQAINAAQLMHLNIDDYNNPAISNTYKWSANPLTFPCKSLRNGNESPTRVNLHQTRSDTNGSWCEWQNQNRNSLPNKVAGLFS